MLSTGLLHAVPWLALRLFYVPLGQTSTQSRAYPATIWDSALRVAQFVELGRSRHVDEVRVRRCCPGWRPRACRVRRLEQRAEGPRQHELTAIGTDGDGWIANERRRKASRHADAGTEHRLQLAFRQGCIIKRHTGYRTVECAAGQGVRIGADDSRSASHGYWSGVRNCIDGLLQNRLAGAELR